MEWEAEKTRLNDLFDLLHIVQHSFDVETFSALLADDLRGWGSDPTETWNKEQIIEIWNRLAGQTPPEIKYFGNRAIHIAPDGHSAFVVEQYMMPDVSEQIPFRTSSYLVKEEGQWKIYSYSMAMIPKNEQIPKLNAALADCR